MTEASQAAKAIKKELKAKFPNSKFRVYKRNYDSLMVLHSDDVSYRGVLDVTQKYEHSSFNAYEDILEMDNVRTDIPQAEIIIVQKL